MQPLQLLYQIPHMLHARSETLTDLMLHRFTNIQEPLYQLTIHEPPRLGIFHVNGLEAAVGIEIQVAKGLH